MNEPTKFYELINFLSKKELNDILKMGKSKSNGLFSDSIDLLDIICKKYLTAKKYHFSLSWVKKHYRNNLSAIRWRNITNNLSDVFIDYILLKKCRNNSLIKIQLLNFFKENNLGINLKLLSKSILKNDENKVIDFSSSYIDFKLQHIHLSLPDNTDLRKHIDNLDDLNNKLDLFYYEKKIMIICAKLSRNRINTSIVLSESEKLFVKNIPKTYLPSLPVLIQKYCFNILSSNCSDSYSNLYEILNKNHQFSKAYLTYGYNVLLNYIVSETNKGNFKISKKYLAIIDKMADLGILINLGSITSGKIKNALAIALKINEIDWLEQFYEKCKGKIYQGKSKNAILSYIKGLIYFSQNKYLDAEAILNSEIPLDFRLKIAKDILLIKIYWHTESDDLIHKIESFNKKIESNETLPLEVKNARKIFSKYLLLVNKNKLDKNKLKSIYQKLEHIGYFPEKDWIISIINVII